MATPDKPGNGSPLRTAGLALLALGVLAAVIGLVLVLTRGGQSGAHPSATVAPPAAPTSTRPSVMPFPPPVSSGTPEAPVVIPSVTPEPAPPPAGQPAPAEAGQPAPAAPNSVSRGEVRVYNNSTIRGLAARAARDLSAAGWTVVEVGNYPSGIISTTTVYYQEGTDQRADAEAIAAQFHMRVEPRFAGIAHASPGIIVIVTNDYGH